MFTATLTLSLLVAVTAQDTPKIHAKTPMRIGTTSSVVRSAEDLGKLQNTDADKASANLAKMFKVEAIDWKKQMVIVVYGGTQRTGGYSVEVKSLEVKDAKLIVNWKLKTPAPGSIVTQALTNPTLTILVDRFEGDVIFEPKAPAAGLGKKLGGS
ncbi:MAG: protease complex subunit PrcB family protein [Planctomycetes bacterium]|nr:protease complex subunit PrcB family protein [Planctomycetota bacterium]